MCRNYWISTQPLMLHVSIYVHMHIYSIINLKILILSLSCFISIWYSGTRSVFLTYFVLKISRLMWCSIVVFISPVCYILSYGKLT